MDYLNKYESNGEKTLINLAQTRIKDIRAELHLKGE